MGRLHWIMIDVRVIGVERTFTGALGTEKEKTRDLAGLSVQCRLGVLWAGEPQTFERYYRPRTEPQGLDTRAGVPINSQKALTCFRCGIFHCQTGCARFTFIVDKSQREFVRCIRHQIRHKIRVDVLYGHGNGVRFLSATGISLQREGKQTNNRRWLWQNVDSLTSVMTQFFGFPLRNRNCGTLNVTLMVMELIVRARTRCGAKGAANKIKTDDRTLTYSN